jgi:hypothetical protein
VLHRCWCWRTATSRSPITSILEAAEAALAGRNDQPDELWLVDTAINSEWTARCLIRDGVGFPDEDTQHRYWDFKPANLEAV